MIRQLLLTLLLLASPAFAQTNLLEGDGQVEITADGSLEYHQEQNVYLAKGNAVAKKGNFIVRADEMTAYQRKSKTGGDEIYKVLGKGSVHITSGKQQVYGENAVYDVDQQVSVLTGRNLKFEDGETTVLARDTLEHWELRKQAIARGNVVALRGKRRVEADAMVAQFRDLPNGDQEVAQVTAQGNVKVVTLQDVAYGDKAVYDLKRDVAVLTGDVKITRGKTQLEGGVAQVDFKAGLSRIMSDGSSGRVRALLPPKSDQE